MPIPKAVRWVRPLGCAGAALIALALPPAALAIDPDRPARERSGPAAAPAPASPAIAVPSPRPPAGVERAADTAGRAVDRADDTARRGIAVGSERATRGPRQFGEALGRRLAPGSSGQADPPSRGPQGTAP